MAASFLSELALTIDKYAGVHITVLASTKVIRSLSPIVDTGVFSSFREVNVYGIKRIKKEYRSLFKGFDCCFTIFGPFYHKIDASHHIVGFAQPWIAYPYNSVYHQLSIIDKIKNKLKFSIQRLVFWTYDELVVEAEHVKVSLVKKGYKKKINVIPNCVSSHFIQSKDIKPLLGKVKGEYTLGYLGKPYKHKNIERLKDVSYILSNKFGLPHKFVFSLSSEEMSSLGFDQLSNFTSVGEISSSQCPAFYKSLDALVFPSLLECFSASPIESMFMGVPVLASKRNFISDFCEDAVVYFDPESDADIASKIFHTLNSPQILEENISKGILLSKKFHSSSDRAEKYMALMIK